MGVTYARAIEGGPTITAVQAAFRQQGVSGRVGVEPANECDRRPNALRLRGLFVERALPEVLVDVPDVPAVRLCGDAQEGRTSFAQAECREPPGHHELVQPRSGRLKALGNEKAFRSVSLEAQAINPRRELTTAPPPAPRLRKARQLPEEAAKGYPRQCAFVQEIVKLLSHAPPPRR
jgi:hypothetical protein